MSARPISRLASRLRRGAQIASLLALVVGTSLLTAQGPGSELPFHIQRVAISPERFTKELDKVKDGTLVLMPQSDFEARVERARLALQGREQRPRLTRAHYVAELIDRAFVNGSGQWHVLHPGRADAILPIDSFNLALARARWEQGSDAILAECDGKSLGLVVKHTGQASCLFDWSLRGIPTNDGLSFRFDLPPCPISTLELKLPADAWLVATKSDVLITGPHDNGSAGQRLWKLQATGTKSLDLTVRKIADPKNQAAAIFARVQSTQHVKVERMEVEHVFDIDVVQGSMRQLFLDGDAGLEPYSVTLTSGEVKAWRVAAPGMLVIDFHQPVQGKLQGLRVRSLGGAPTAGWTSPALAVRGALSRGETLELHLHPDVPLGRWDPGSFQPTQILTDSDGTQVITLAQTAADHASARRPSLTAPARALDVHTTETCRWQILPRRAVLHADILYAPARGNLFELRVKLPKVVPGYQIDALELHPPELLSDWRVDGGFIVVELKQALMPMKKANLKIRMQSASREPAAVTLSYPDLEPVDGARRQGTLAIEVDPIFRSQLVSAPAPLAPASSPGSGADYRFTFRDQRPAAVVRLQPQPVQAELRGEHAVVLGEQHMALRFRWEAQPLVGAPEYLDFRFAPGFPARWRIKDDPESLRIVRWERRELQEVLPQLLQLGSRHLVHVAGLEMLAPAGTCWRFHFAEPLRKKGYFTLEAESPAGLEEDTWRNVSLLLPSCHPWEMVSGGLAQQVGPASAVKVWSAPLMSPMQTANVEQEVLVTPTPTEPIFRFATDGPLQAPPGDKAATPLRLHQVASGFAPHASKVMLWTDPAKKTASTLELCDHAELATYVQRDGIATYRVRFRVWHWHDRACQLGLPSGFQVLAVRVQDHWLNSLDVSSGSGPVRLTLPIDQSADFTQFEVLARCEPTAGVPGLRQVPIPRIDWPIAPLEVRQRIYLEEGVTPLRQESLAPVGVPRRLASQTPTGRQMRRLWDWGRAWLPVGANARLLAGLEQQRQAVLLEEAHLRAAAGKSLKLSEALERLALDHLKDQAPLVIDAIAFRSLGLDRDTTVTFSSRPFWEALGLIYVPCPGGALLTTTARMQKLGIEGPLQAADLDEAIQEAVENGRDASSGFWLVLSWLRSAEPQAARADAELLATGAEMTEWTPVGMGPVDGFYVVDPVPARGLGLLLALAAMLALWKLHRSLPPLGCFRAYLILLAVGVFVGSVSPRNVAEYVLMPALIVMAGGFLWCVVRVIGRGSAQPAGENSTVSQAAASVSVAVILAGVLGLSWSATAQPAAMRTYSVLIMDGEKPAVLAPAELLAKLDEQESPAATAAPTAVLVSARYLGNASDVQTQFDAQFEIYSFQDKADLVIPLTGVLLGEAAYLDGAPVYPAPHKNGYVLPIRARGPHNLRLSFTVRTGGDEQHHLLRFNVPKLPQNQVAVQWAMPVRAVHAQRSWGEERVVSGPQQSVKEYQAQLGYERKVELRWPKTSATAPAVKTTDVKEAHFWDLRPASPSLLSSFHYSLGLNSTSQFAIALPEGMQVRGAEVMATPLSGPATPIGIKHWQVTGKGDQRRLTVDLVQPLTGQVTLNLEIIPTAPGQKTVLPLALPAALQGVASSGMLAYRLEAAETKRTAQNLVAVANIPPGDFEQQWKKQNAPTLPAGSALLRAYSFRRTGVKAALEIATQPSARQAQGQITWEIDQHHADLQATFALASTREDLLVVEFFVDKSVTLAEVAGPDVRRWHLDDGRLQVWLKQARKETSIKLIGWRTSPIKGTALKEQTFTLPAIYPLQSRIAGAALTVRPVPGFRLEVEKDKNPKASVPLKLRGLRIDSTTRHQFIIEEAPYEAVFRLIPTAGALQATSLTKVHKSDQGLEYWHAIKITTERGRLPVLKLHLKDWRGEPLAVEAPGAIVQRVPDKVSKHPVWNITYLPGAPQERLPREVTITVHGRIKIDAQLSRPLPALELENATMVQPLLLWKDIEIENGKTGKKLEHRKAAAGALDSPTGDGWAIDLHAWKSARDERNLQAVLPRVVTGGSLRALSAAERTCAVSTGRWLHEASYQVHAAETAPLRFRFPAPPVKLEAWVDHRLQAASQPGGAELVLSLQASSLPQHIVLRWEYDAEIETRELPNVAPVQLEHTSSLTQLHWLTMPPDTTVARPAHVPPFLLAKLLHEASEHMQVAATLGKEPLRSADANKALLDRQLRFHACLRQADYLLALWKVARPRQDAAPWRERLDELQTRNLTFAKNRGYEDQRKAAQKAPILRVPDPAMAALAPGLAIAVDPGIAQLALRSSAAQAAAEARTRAELFLLGAVSLLVISYFRRGWTFLRVCSPELAIVLAAAAMALHGLSLFGIGLIAAMLLIRIIWLTRYLRLRFAS